MHKLTPERIYQEFKNQKLAKYRAIDLLIYLIENEPTHFTRKSGLQYLGKIGLYERKVFQFLENLLLSDYNEWIRGLAAELIIQNFPDMGYKPIKWVLKHEKSEVCLSSVIKTLNLVDHPKLRSLQNQVDYVIYEDKIYFPSRSKEVLNLNQKSIGDIDQILGLGNLNRIEALYLQDNQISDVKGFDNLLNLKTLSLKSNHIKEIKGLKNQPYLKTLYLQANKIKEIREIKLLQGLESLFLDRNEISKIKGFQNSTNLKTLSLNDNQISEIGGLDNLLNLEELFLRGNSIKEIASLGQLKKLKRLDLGDNQISEIKGLENLVNLEYLNLNNNEIDEIKGLENLKKLKYLNLGSNEISKIKRLEKLTSLEYLYLENNFISEIENLESLKNLKILDLRNTDISWIRDNIVLLPHLKELNLINCPILKELQGLTELKKLSEKILNIIRYNNSDEWYREPISKEIVEISYIQNTIDSIISLKEAISRRDLINYLCDSQWKVVRYSKDIEIYSFSRSGKIVRV